MFSDFLEIINHKVSTKKVNYIINYFAIEYFVLI